MMIAPHPDDESLAAGVLLQKAIAARAAVRLVYITDGDDNPWPQRALEKRWRLNAKDRARWGKRRKQEALDALAVLGLKSSDACFLGWPDQGLTHALLHECEKTSARIGRLIAEWKPTHLLLPSETDTHPDHSAVALLVRFALDQPGVRPRDCALFSYLVHGYRPRFVTRATTLPQSAEEAAVKRNAIIKHWTQVKFSRRRFLSYAARPECFQQLSQSPRSVAKSPNCAAFRNREQLRLVLRFRFKPISVEPIALYLIGRHRRGTPLALCLRLPSRDASIQMTDCVTKHRIGLATYRGNSVGGVVGIPMMIFAQDWPIFVKVRQRRWFFDKAGWMEIPPAPSERKSISAAIEQSLVAA